MSVPTPPNDDSRELFRLLVDREWHRYEEVKEAIAAKVPPGRALRRYNEDIEARRRLRNDPKYDTAHDDDLRIEFGRRRCAQAVITSWKGKGVITEIRGDEKWIKAKPGFTSPFLSGFEPERPAEGQDPPLEAEGYTEVPPDDSEPSESHPTTEILPPPVQWDSLAEYLASARQGGPVWTSETPRARVKVQALEGLRPEDVPLVTRMIEDTVAKIEREMDNDPGNEPEPTTDGRYAESEYAWPSTALGVCAECGLTVGNATLHNSWHEDVVKESAQKTGSELDESQVRDVVRDVMGQVLDDFQRGMQAYLETQFAHVNGGVLQVLRLLRQSTSHDSWRSRELRHQ